METCYYERKNLLNRLTHRVKELENVCLSK